MDPLIVTGGLGEQVDPGLVDRDPVTVTEVLPDGAQEIVGSSEDGGHTAANLSARQRLQHR